MAEDVETVAEQRNRAELADLLRREIASGKYPVGSKLPSYRQLAEQTGAATNTVGEAVRMLAAEGLVKIKPNAGAVVRTPESQPRTAEQEARDVRVGLTEVRDQLREVRRDLDALDSRVSDLIDKLPTD